MRAVRSMTFLLVFFLSCCVETKKPKVFKPEHIVFSSDFNITKLMVPFDGSQYMPSDTADFPPIFFTVSDPILEGGSCIYVLEGFAAYEIIEGGRDTTTSYGQDASVYFGTYKGVYKYIPNSLSAKRFGPFRDDIIQLQKAKDADLIYYLTSDYKLYKIENNGTMRTNVEDVICASQFVLDTSNNIYYISCYSNMLRILKTDGTTLGVVQSLVEDVVDITLLRPAFIMEESVPFLGDNNLYFLFSNGTSQKKDLHLDEKPSAFSVDAALYLVGALDGKIYEFNVMDILLRTMFGFKSDFPADIGKIIMSFIDTTKKHIELEDRDKYYINQVLNV